MSQIEIESNESEINKKKLTWTEYIIINYRWVLVIVFLLPISVLYDLYYYTRAKVIFALNSAPSMHDEKVSAVQKQVQGWSNGDRSTHMCTSRPGWQTISFRQPAYKSTFHKIDINLVDIIKVDTEKKIVQCEPLVTMGQLSHSLLRLGWTIPVLPELDDLTVGGLVMGTGIESSSHIYGLFQHICMAFELVLSDGSVVTCSQSVDPDLFYSVPWSYGTLGFLTSVDIKIIPVKRYLQVKYYPCQTHEDLVKTFSSVSNDHENSFVEGLQYSWESGVVMTANMTDEPQQDKINSIGRWYKPWFFKHVEETYLKQNKKGVEYIPIRDYYHRHTKSIFWELQEILPFGNNVLFRWLFGWLIPPKVSLLKLTQGETIKKLYEENHFIQDMLVPMEQLSSALKVFHEEVQIYPIWLCSFRLPRRPGMLQSPSCDDDYVTDSDHQEPLYVDIGTYGTPAVDNFHPEETTRRVEEFVRKVKGFQMLYADSYLTEEEFRQMFDHSLYDRVRNRLQCHQAFPEIYHKVNRKARI